MIPRTLVPDNARLQSDDAAPPAPKKTSSSLDTRTLVPAGLPATPLDGRSTIPAHLPLEAISARVVIPRDLPVAPLDLTRTIPAHVPLTVLGARVAVPQDAAPPRLEPKPPVSAFGLPELVDPDLFTTGEVNLLVSPEEERRTDWRAVTQVVSVVVHVLAVVFLLALPKLFPYRPPTQEEVDIARRQLSFVYLPPETTSVPKIAPSPNELRSEKMRIDPRILRQVAPPNAEPQPLPGALEPERVVRDATAPSQPRANPPGGEDALRRNISPQQPLRLEAPDTSEKTSSLQLPKVSPGRALQESLREAARGAGGHSAIVSGPPPDSPGGGGSGPSQGLLSNGYELLTPTEGVDFSNYLARVLASVRRNWFVVIPESARLGDRGRVILQFKIMRNGGVPSDEPVLLATSGKEPLDRAAASSIRASNPFEPLPPAFSGPFIELRFIFLYNLPLSAAQ